MIDLFKCMEEHECLDCDERCGCYGDCHSCDNELPEYCEKCVYKYRKDKLDNG